MLHSVLGRYNPRDVFNADETGLFWRRLPDKKLAFKHEKCHGGKKSKEGIATMVCTNMNESKKWPLLVIGKFKNPKCFIRIRQLPTEYEANKRAWMTGELFIKWMRSFDAAMAKAKRKVLLVVDNCTARSHVAGLKATELLFLPPNATVKLEPCDCGIIKNLESYYRSLILCKLLQHFDSEFKAAEFSRNIFDALTLLKMVWDLVTIATVENCLKKAGFHTDSATIVVETDEPSVMPLVEGLLDRGLIDSSFAANDFFNVDSEVLVSPAMTVAEVVSSLQHSAKADNSSTQDGSEDDSGDEVPLVSHYEASNCLQKL